MRYSFFSFYLIFGIIIFGNQIKAQTHEVGIQAGVANYKGELAPSINYDTPGPYANVFYRANLGKAFSLRGNASFSKISDNDSGSDDTFARLRNHNFSTIVLELSAQAEYNFLNFRGGGRYEKQSFTPYVFSGIGLVVFLSLGLTSKI